MTHTKSQLAEHTAPSGGSSQFSVVFNAAPATDSHDTVGGSKYSHNKTDGSSTGFFGNIGNLGLPRPEYQGLSTRNTSMEGPECEFRGRTHISSKISRNQRATQAASVHLSPSDEQDTSASRSLSRRRSVSMSSIHSGHSEVSYRERIIFEEPEQFIFERRNTASWFERGKMFEVSSQMPSENMNAAVAGYSLIVVGRRGSSIICLPLRQHSDIKKGDKSFLESRVRIYARGSPDASDLELGACPWTPLAIDLDPGRALLHNVWVNIAEPHTIKSEHIQVALHGVLDEKELKALRRLYLYAQNRITDLGEDSQGSFFWCLSAFWRSVKGLFGWLVDECCGYC